MNLATREGQIIGALAGIGAMLVGAASVDDEQFANDVTNGVARFQAKFSEAETAHALRALVVEAVTGGAPDPLRN